MRTKLLRISGELLADFLKNPIPPGVTQKGMPPDAEIVGAEFDSIERVLKLKISSGEFEADGGDLDLLLTTSPLTVQGAERKGRADLLLYLIGVAQKTRGAEIWRALFAEMLAGSK